MREFATSLKKKHRSAEVREGRRVYAIGDIHGHLDELNQLLDWIERDMESHDGKAHLVFLGDYIDRGPDTKGVIKRLRGKSLPGHKRHFLKGNHEAVLLELLDGKTDNGNGWLRYGGMEMLESYGVTRKEIVKRAGTLARLVEDVVPKKHLDFLRALKPMIEIDDFLFVHAGIRPGRKIEKQKERDLLWIRNEFIRSDKDHGKVVVHGHTIEVEPRDRRNRIGLDTGCYAGGSLSAVRLEGTGRHFVSIPSKGASWPR